MKKVLQITLLAGLFIILAGCKNEKENKNSSGVSAEEGKACDYIEEYYQTVYQAEIAYLKQDYQKAFSLLKEAESRCELLNQSLIIINETEMLAELYIRLDKPEGAFPYLYKLLEKGHSFSSIDNNEIFYVLKATPEWEKLKREAPVIENEFQENINVDLRKEILAMRVEDQRVSIDGFDRILSSRTHTVHQERIKEIFNQFGYPNSDLVGHGYFNERPDIGLMLMHFKDTTWFKPRLLNYIRKGEAPADVLANMIDRRRVNTNEYTYGIYHNTDSSKIKNFHDLDRRRLSVGLRSFSMQKEYEKLKGI